MNSSKLITQNSQLIVLIGVFIALATVYSLVVPLGEGPDEPGHAAYVFFLARTGRLPMQRAEPQPSDVPGEGHQPPLAYALATPMVAWLAPQERAFDLPGNARFTWAGGAELNAVAHGSREYPPWRGAVLAWHLARLVSVAIGALTVLCTYRAALALLGATGRATALLAALLVALNPQFLFTAALVTNDVLLAALSAALLWLVAANERCAGGRLRYAIGIGAALGLALITKQSALLLVPAALLAVGWRGYKDARGAGGRGYLREIGRPLLLVSGAALLVAGWWYARNLRLYGDLFGLAAFRAEFATQPFEPGNPAAWAGALAQLHDSFWARFGWMNVPAPAWAIAIFALVEAVGAAGLLAAAIGAWRRASDERRATNDQRPTTNDHQGSVSSFIVHRSSFPSPCHSGAWWALIALPILAFAWVVAFAVTAGLVAWQGRLMFPALPSIAILLALGITRMTGSGWLAKARERFSYALLPVPLFLIAIWMPFGVIQPAYPFHTLPEQTARARIGTPAYGRFGLPGEQGAELLGWRLEGTARAGATPELVLIWHALARQNRDWVVFIHLVDDREQIVAEDDRPPQDGAFPMTQWVEGDWVEDRHPLALPPGLAPGTYAIRVGLFDPRGRQQRLGVYNERGKLRGDYLKLGSITISR